MASALVLSYPIKRNHSSAFDVADDSLRHYKRPCHAATGFSPSPTTSQFCGLAVDTQAINSSNFSLKPNYVPRGSKSLEQELILSNGSKCLIGDEANVCRTAKGAVNGNSGDIVTPENPSAAPVTLPTDGSQWVDLFLKEMMTAADLADARARTSRVLDVLENSIMARVSSEAIQNIQKENMVLKEQNNILKRAVGIQHERQKEYDTMNEELQHLKQLVTKYQEQLRTLEVNNYALAMHLKQSQQSSSMPGHFHPDIF
ncbi:hypothetical protein J5N97_007854 [Dioscorea zingiberensis]|uniref:Uncharacterized protein n=1 Tax=Dioscorea zingiberensis TaxID=325984 RepID=A0A9D5DED6_9LILI|nr:hypothetical protein J5N97_007854 [Dioscorea zingiberensis]